MYDTLDKRNLPLEKQGQSTDGIYCTVDIGVIFFIIVTLHSEPPAATISSLVDVESEQIAFTFYVPSSKCAVHAL